MNDFINRFMTGKKKISTAALIPIVVAGIQMIVGDPEQAETLIEMVQEFLPTIVALVGGLGYAIIEGVNDNTKIKVNAGSGTSGTAAIKQDVVGVTGGHPDYESQDVAGAPMESGAGHPAPEQKTYAVPFDVTQVRLNDDPFLSYEQFEDYFYSLDLRAFNPEIAFEFAGQVLDEGFRRAGLAWKDLFRKAGVTADVRLPVAADFQTSKTSGNMLDQLTEAAEQEFNALIPQDCSRLAYNVHNINQIVIVFSTLYSIQNVFKLLAGKTINWNKVATIMDIRRVGLGSV
jgi:hypothetical protein